MTSLEWIRNLVLGIVKDLWYIKIYQHFTMSWVKVMQSCPPLWDPMDCIVHGNLQARILEWVSLSLLQWIFPTQESNPGLLHCRQILYQLSYEGSPHNVLKSESEVAQSRLTLCDPMDCLPGSSIHGIFQARILEQVAISFSRRSSGPRDWSWVSLILGRRFTIWAMREVPQCPKPCVYPKVPDNSLQESYLKKVACLSF